MRNRVLLAILLVLQILVSGCGRSQPAAEAEEIARFPIDSLDGLVTRSGVELDTEVTSDGNGSLRIAAAEPTVVRLFELEEIDVENARLSYRARLRTEEVDGQAYLEMWCLFEGEGEFFSRGLHAPLSGTIDWTLQEIPFFLQAGQNPDLVRLNVVIDGSGTLWVDDLVVSKGPLE